MACEMQKTGIMNRKLWLQCAGDFVSSFIGTRMILSVDMWYKLFSEASYIYKGRHPGRQTVSEAKASEVGAAFF